MERYENPAFVIGEGANDSGRIENLGTSGIDASCIVEEKDYTVCSNFCKECFVFLGVENHLQELKVFLIVHAPENQG